MSDTKSRREMAVLVTHRRGLEKLKQVNADAKANLKAQGVPDHSPVASQYMVNARNHAEARIAEEVSAVQNTPADQLPTELESNTELVRLAAREL